MFQSEFSAFQQLMVDLCEAFNRPLKDDLVRVFWEALKDFPLQQVRSRVRLHIANAKKFPSPAELRPPLDDSARKPSGPGPVEVLDEYVRKKYPNSCANLGWIGDAGAIVGVHVQGVGKIYLRDVL